MLPITLVIPTFNSGFYLEHILYQLSKVFKDILIVDSFSTDNTLSVAKSFGAFVIQREYKDSASQKNFALSTLPKGTWAFFLDSDEVLSDELLAELSGLNLQDESVGLFRIPRRNLFWRMDVYSFKRHKDYQTRLLKVGYSSWEDKRVHAKAFSSLSVQNLSGWIIHDDFTSLTTWWMRNNRYFSYEVEELMHRQRNFSLFSLIILKPAYVFVLHFIRRRGYRYGWKGLFHAALWFVYHLIVGVKYYETIHKYDDGRKNSFTNSESK